MDNRTGEQLSRILVFTEPMGCKGCYDGRRGLNRNHKILIRLPEYLAYT